MRGVAQRVVLVASIIVLFAAGCGDRNDGLTASDPMDITTETLFPAAVMRGTYRGELESIGVFVTEGEDYDTGHKISADGQGPAEVVPGRLSLYFDGGKIREQVSDYWHEWTYEMDAYGRIDAYDHNGHRAKGGRYDLVSRRLYWSGRWYVPRYQ